MLTRRLGKEGLAWSVETGVDVSLLKLEYSGTSVLIPSPGQYCGNIWLGRRFALTYDSLAK